MEFFSAKIKKSLLFQEMEHSCSKIKKFLIFSQKKGFLIFREMEIFYILGNGNPEIIPYISERELSDTSGNKNPEKLLIFHEVTFRA